MADRIRSWFLHLSPEQQNGLLQELLDCDKEKRVDYQEGLAKKVESDVISMMNQLGELIEKKNHLFKGRMMQCGSSYNQTKVGQPDEMDFAFQWDLSESSRSEDIVHIEFYSRGLKHIERFGGDPNDLPEFSVIPVDTVFLNFSIKSWDNSGHVDDDVRPKYIHCRFVRAVNDALMKMELLLDWEHGGFASPDCTGTRENGAALMMQFICNPENGEKLKLTVDLVLAIDLREIYDGDLEDVCALRSGSTWQHELLKKRHFLDKVLIKIHDSLLVDSTFAERIWLSSMDVEHPVKIVVRIFKILIQMALRHPDTDMTIDSSLYSVDKNRMVSLKNLQRCMANYHAAEDKEDLRERATYRLRTRPIKELQYHDMKVPEGERLVDLGECLGYRPFLKSHVFQSLVLALYALRCTEHPDTAEDKIWSKDDIPTIVVNVMMIIQRFLDGSVDKDTGSSRSRFWHFPQLYLESEGCRYRLHQPESLCLDVYRGETVKQHFVRIVHLFQQLTHQQGADDNLCGPDEATPPAETDEEVVHLLPLDRPI